MKKNPLISIIVPVYNVEKYLAKCLDSLISQTYRNIEIIIVNDGSTDNSLNIINEYKAKDSRISVINKINRGLASARNTGVAVSKGEYIWHVDSDDYAELNSLYNMLCCALSNNADIVITGYYCENENYECTNIRSARHVGTISGTEALCLMLRMEIGGEVWSKLYKKELYDRGNIRQDESYSEVEDMLLNYQMFSCANKVCFLDDYTIHHLYRSQSYSSTAKQSLFRIKHHLGILSLIQRGFASKEIEFAYYGYLFSDFLTCISMKNWDLLKSLSFTKIRVLASYLRYASSYSLLKKERSSKKIELLAFGAKKSITRYISAFILRLYFESFKYRYSK